MAPPAAPIAAVPPPVRLPLESRRALCSVRPCVSPIAPPEKTHDPWPVNVADCADALPVRAPPFARPNCMMWPLSGATPASQLPAGPRPVLLEPVQFIG